MIIDKKPRRYSICDVTRQVDCNDFSPTRNNSIISGSVYFIKILIYKVKVFVKVFGKCQCLLSIIKIIIIGVFNILFCKISEVARTIMPFTVFSRCFSSARFGSYLLP